MTTTNSIDYLDIFQAPFLNEADEYLKESEIFNAEADTCTQWEQAVAEIMSFLPRIYSNGILAGLNPFLIQSNLENDLTPDKNNLKNLLADMETTFIATNLSKKTLAKFSNIDVGQDTIELSGYTGTQDELIHDLTKLQECFNFICASGYKPNPHGFNFSAIWIDIQFQIGDTKITDMEINGETVKITHPDLVSIIKVLIKEMDFETRTLKIDHLKI